MRECTQCSEKKELEKFVKNGPYYRYLCTECNNYNRRKNKDRSGTLKKGEGHWLGKKLSDETRKKIGDAQRGKKQSPESIEKRRLSNLGQRRKETRHSCRKYWEWRDAVKEKDSWKCQHCGCEERKILHAHHIIAWEKDKNLRFDISNGMTLCKHCHAKEENKPKIGKSFSKETEFKKGQVAHNKGIPMPLELKEKLRCSNMGRIPWNKGVLMSESQKKKLSDSHKCQIPWNKGLNKYGPDTRFEYK